MSTIGSMRSGAPPRGRATPARELGQLGAQRGIETIREAREDRSAFAGRQPDPLVATERDVHTGVI
jgi:hypothetical protein